MRRSLVLLQSLKPSEKINLIQIRNGTFYRHHPSLDHDNQHSPNPPLFPNLNFELPASASVEGGESERRRLDGHWAVIGPSDGTTFLEILRGSHLCFPPNARSYPYLSSDHIDDRKDHRLRIPSRAIQYVGFNTSKDQLSGGAAGGVRGAYLSARYESRREETDWTLAQYLKGQTELNPGTKFEDQRVDDGLLKEVVSDLRLERLLTMPVSNLSNGQTRRSRIAKALLGRPLLLLLDEPFMGLDPPTLVKLSPMLCRLAHQSRPLLMLALRPQDPIPDWITHLVVLGHNHSVALTGDKDSVLQSVLRWTALTSKWQAGNSTGSADRLAEQILTRYGPPPSGVGDVLGESGISKHPLWDGGVSAEQETQWKSKTGGHLDSLLKLAVAESAPISERAKLPRADPPATRTQPRGDPLIELSSVVVKYGFKTVLGGGPPQPGFSSPGLNLTIRRGTRLALLGPNGSGKTTLLSLLTSDHPQSYSLPIQFFGRSRLPSAGVPGLSLWEIQSRIGHSSPEIHAFFPKHLTVRRALESAWADTYAERPRLTPERAAEVERVLEYWEPELRQDSQDTSQPPGSLTWASDKTTHTFHDLPFGAQRLLLLLRALIKRPDIVILDEAFSGLSARTRDKAMAFMERGTPEIAGLSPSQALVVVSHVREEIPDTVDEWLRLPGEDELLEGSRGVEGGHSLESGEIKSQRGWMRVWGL